MLIPMTDATPETHTRGPAEHAVRDQIVEAANECFARYGYAKTTVADLAREIGFSKAYIYRFFESKQAIGEAICGSRLQHIVAETRQTVDEGGSAAERFRRMFKMLTKLSVELFFHDRKIYDITAHSAAEQWSSSQAYKKPCARCSRRSSGSAAKMANSNARRHWMKPAARSSTR
jgi:AcrR family transcriptional regulator